MNCAIYESRIGHRSPFIDPNLYCRRPKNLFVNRFPFFPFFLEGRRKTYTKKPSWICRSYYSPFDWQTQPCPRFPIRVPTAHTRDTTTKTDKKFMTYPSSIPRCSVVKILYDDLPLCSPLTLSSESKERKSPRRVLLLQHIIRRLFFFEAVVCCVNCLQPERRERERRPFPHENLI